jgi:hypothetical protein
VLSAQIAVPPAPIVYPRSLLLQPGPDPWAEAQGILRVLRTLRIQKAVEAEQQMHDEVAAVLTAAGVPFEHEYRLAPRCRIDFLIGGGIGIEIKKGKPNSTEVNAQVARYARLGELSAIILLVERNAMGVRESWASHGIPAFYLGLSKLWGVAL